MGIPPASYEGRLVPFSGGLAYEENPTITYMPVQGAQYLRQLMSPIPLDILVLFVRWGTNMKATLALLVNRINDMQNPDFMAGSSAKSDSRFQRFTELNTELTQAGVLQWVEDPREDVPFDILITGYSPVYSELVREYLNLLGMTKPTDESTDIVFPVILGIKGRDLDGIAIDYPTVGLAVKNIRIHSSKEKPEGAAVAVKHRGYWFYIDDTDPYTKLFYTMVRTLWSVSTAAATDQKVAPVLTIPVSR